MPQDQQVIIFIITTTAIIFFLTLLMVILLLSYNNKKLTYQNTLESLKSDFEKNLLKTQIEVQEQTFQHISREIHDNINLSLTLVKLNLNTLEVNDPDLLKKSISSSIETISSAITELSQLSKSMNTEMIQELGLIRVIKTEIDKIENLSKLKVTYKIKGEPIFLDCQKELIVFRIIQEAFNNVLKHSKASNAWVELNYNEDFLDVLIGDNGIGFNRDLYNSCKNSKAGLHNMEMRTKTFGGQFYLNTFPKRGTKILISVPY